MFIRSSSSVHLDCFLLLAVVNNAAMVRYKYLLEPLLSVLWSIYPEVEMLGHQVVHIYIFEEPLCYLS